MDEEFRRWLEFTFRTSEDRLVIQDRPTSTTALTREQALQLVRHVRQVAMGLPTLRQRLGAPRGDCPACEGRGVIWTPANALNPDEEHDCSACEGTGYAR